MPARSSAYRVAGIGADSIRIGSSPRTASWWIRARGVSPCSSTARSEAISRAAEPSEICDATAAVRRPPSASGFSPDIFSSVVSRRGPSSCFTPARGSISRSNRPSSIARRARWWDSYANASMSSRVMSQSRAIISAPWNWVTGVSPYRLRHPSEPENGSS